MKRYITFSGRAYDDSTRLIVENAPRMGAEEVWVYDDAWLVEHEFYKLNHWLWEHHGDQHNNKRGFGWFAWKPLVILDALDHSQPGDIILYTDGDTHPIHDFSMLYDECHRIGGAMLFRAEGHGNGLWCKRDCYVVMGQDEPKYTKFELPHGVARFRS